jgi:hypothetical protein
MRESPSWYDNQYFPSNDLFQTSISIAASTKRSRQDPSDSPELDQCLSSPCSRQHGMFLKSCIGNSGTSPGQGILIERAPEPLILQRNMSSKMNWKHYGMGNSLTSAVAEALPDVIHVDLCDNRISATGMKNVFSALSAKSDTLETLILSENNLKGCFQHLASFLKMTSRVQVLKLSRTSLNDLDLECLSKSFFSYNVTMKILDLSHNRIGTRGGQILADVLEINTSIKELDIRWNSIRGVGAVSIGTALSQNSSMEIFSASWNGFGDKGAAALAEALKFANSRLKCVDLSSNSIGDEGGTAFMHAMRINRSLQSLQLNGNLFSPGLKRSMLNFLAGDEAGQRLHQQEDQTAFENTRVIQRTIGEVKTLRNSQGQTLGEPNVVIQGRVALQTVIKNGPKNVGYDAESSTQGYFAITFSSDGTTKDAKLTKTGLYDMHASEPHERVKSNPPYFSTPPPLKDAVDASFSRCYLSDQWLKGDFEFGACATGIVDVSSDGQARQKPLCLPTNLPSAAGEVEEATSFAAVVRNLI